ncbi:MAG: hypothetical protein WCG05_02090 [Alphaproteobacteria bacterium]
MVKHSTEQKKFLAFIKSAKETNPPFGPDTRYYLDLYEHFRLGKWFQSWNWAVFLLSFFDLDYYWFLYRRMYWNAFFLFLGRTTFIVSLIFALQKVNLGPYLPKIIIYLFRMILSLGLGVFANALYFKFVKRKMYSVKPGQGLGPNPILPIIVLMIQIAYLSMIFRLLIDQPEAFKKLLQGFYFS